jgi:transposase
MKRLPVVGHLSADEIDRRYRGCPDAAEKTRWHVLWLVSRPDHPTSATTAARLVGFTPAWGRAILKRYNAGGPDTLTDGRRNNGADPKLTPAQQAELFAALQVPPPDHGLWSGPKVAAFVKDRWGVEVGKQTGWQWLKDLGFRLVVPRPRHPKVATPERQAEWL